MVDLIFQNVVDHDEFNAWFQRMHQYLTKFLEHSSVGLALARPGPSRLWLTSDGIAVHVQKRIGSGYFTFLHIQNLYHFKFELVFELLPITYDNSIQYSRLSNVFFFFLIFGRNYGQLIAVIAKYLSSKCNSCLLATSAD